MDDLSWAAGLFVGEGTIFIQHRRKGTEKEQRYITVSLLMTDERTVKRFREIVTPYATYTRKRTKPNALNGFTPKRPNSKPVFQFTMTGSGAVGVARTLYPYLAGTDKGDQMERVFKQMGLTL
jgi:hypothetical protein